MSALMPTGSTMHAGRQALTTGRQDLSMTSAIAKELPPYRLDTVNSRHAGGERFRVHVLGPDSEGDAAYHALESALYRLRQLLGARDAVRMEGGKVSLNRDQLWVDMWKFEE
jgi:hypothetical protein